MRFWAREVIGWALVCLGLFVFFFAFLFLLEHYILEGGPLTFIGFVLFRGGVHLLKVSMAARVCMRAQEGLDMKPAGAGALPLASRPPSKVVATRR